MYKKLSAGQIESYKNYKIVVVRKIFFIVFSICFCYAQFSSQNINKIADKGSFFEVAENFAQNVVVGLARLRGRTIGILANQPKVLAGTLDIDSSNKNIKINLNKLMNFDNFITGECNRFAYSSAFEIAENPGDYYNPFYIFSKYGIGKTHLLNSIGNKINNYEKLKTDHFYFAGTFCLLGLR